MKRLFFVLYAVAITVVANPALGQDSPLEMLAKVENHGLSRAAGTPAFHLKADFQASGTVEFKGAGTYEEWWSDPAHWRKEAVLGKYHLLLLCVDGKVFRDSTEDYIPMRVYEMLHAALPPLPTQKEMADGPWSAGKATVQNTELLRLSRRGDPPKDGKLVPPEFAYYIDPRTNVVLLHDIGFDLYSYDRPAMLADRAVMLHGSLRRNGKIVLDFHITSLTTLPTLDVQLMQVPPSAKPGFGYGIPPHADWKSPVRVLGHVDFNKVRQRGTPSEVIADMQLDTTGAVREVDLIYSTDSIVADEITYDLHHFKYAPTVVEGIPVTAFQTYTSKEGIHEMWRSIN